FIASTVRKNDLTFHRSCRQQFDRLSRFKQLEFTRDEWVHFLCVQQRKDLWQIFAQRLRVLAVDRGDTVKGSPPPSQTRSYEKIGKHRHLSKHSRCTHETESDYQTSRAQRSDTVTDVGTSNRIKSAVHTFGFEGAHQLIHRACPVVN